MRVAQISDGAVPNSTNEELQLLLERIARDRDREAFRALFLFFGPRVKALMMKGGADREFAEDIVQDVMLNVWNKVHLYAPERGSASAWVYTIARNARIDRLRRGSSRPHEDVSAIEIASTEADGEDAFLATQRAERIAEALETLPDEQRQIIDYAFMRDMTQSDIAEKLGLPLGTVKSRMRLAYAKLRERLEGLQ